MVVINKARSIDPRLQARSCFVFLALMSSRALKMSMQQILSMRSAVSNGTDSGDNSAHFDQEDLRTPFSSTLANGKDHSPSGLKAASVTRIANGEYHVEGVTLAHKYGRPLPVDVVVSNAGAGALRFQVLTFRVSASFPAPVLVRRGSVAPMDRRNSLSNYVNSLHSSSAQVW
jgi:hypothetical protein